jgi:hypothetical protein
VNKRSSFAECFEYSYLTVALALMISDCDIHLFTSEVEGCKRGAVCHGGNGKHSVGSVIGGRRLL